MGSATYLSQRHLHGVTGLRTPVYHSLPALLVFWMLLPAMGWAGDKETFRFRSHLESAPGYAELGQVASAESSRSSNPKLRVAQQRQNVKPFERQPKQRGDLTFNWNYFKGIFTDTAHIVTSPARWGLSDWFRASLVVGGTSIFFAVDEDINEWFQDNRDNDTDNWAEVFEPLGNGAVSVPVLAVFYIAGELADSSKIKRVALLSLEGFAITGLLTTVIKFATGRARPNQLGNNSDDWDGFSFSGNHSFPSGHTSTAFAIATVFANEYEEQIWVPPVAYTLSTLTGLSRMNDRKHWASDVFFGAALGYFISKTILKLHSAKKGRHFTIYPRISKRETGIAMNYRF